LGRDRRRRADQLGKTQHHMFEVLIDLQDRAQVPNRDLTGFQRVAEPRWGEDGDVAVVGAVEAGGQVVVPGGELIGLFTDNGRQRSCGLSRWTGLSPAIRERCRRGCGLTAGSFLVIGLRNAIGRFPITDLDQSARS
jgi:hypothetical protein